MPEPTPPEIYQVSGKMRAILVVLLVTMNLLAARNMPGGEMGARWRAHMATSIPVWLLDGVIGLLMWRLPLSTRTLRGLTFLCATLETVLALKSLHMFGAVNSHLLLMLTMQLIVYRMFFDFAIGLYTFSISILGLWLIVLAEVRRWIPPQAVLGDAIDAIYQLPSREIGAATMLTGELVALFFMVNWVTMRLRHGELAVRALRQELHARDAGQVGRHSGRMLVMQYQVLGLLGRGGMGEVYSGTRKSSGAPVAIKMIHPHLIDDPAMLHRFRRESEIMRSLRSEHLVSLLDVGEDEGQPFFVLELLDGESLGTRVQRKGPMEPDAVADIAAQLADGLSVAHAAGVVHRDLKPENVFLCRREGEKALVKILDFGVSKIRDGNTRLTEDATLLGTPDFMSPEQATGRAEEVDQRTDTFALGGIVYFMLTGRPPFEAASVPATLVRICEDEPISLAQLRPDLPTGLSTVLRIALAKDPEQRYRDARELARDLAAACDDALDAEASIRAERVEMRSTKPRTEIISEVRPVEGATTLVSEHRQES